jgi:predicted O-methyltransferase YrrM
LFDKQAMRFQKKLARFSRKSPQEKWAAINAMLRSAPPFRMMRTIADFRQRLRDVIMQTKARDIASGIGDSGSLLYGLVRSMKPEICVEIGSARGKSACFIGMALKENGHGRLYAIDPHEPTAWNDTNSVDTFETFLGNISALELSKQVTVIRSHSQDAARDWDRPIDLIFIDGDHSYEGVKRDWDLFVPHIKPFGIVVFHDTMWDLPPYQIGARDDIGVPRFVDDLRRRGYQVLTIDRDYGVSLVQPTVGGRPLRELTAPEISAQSAVTSETTAC